MSATSVNCDVVIDDAGIATFIYSDELHCLVGLGNARVMRASFVEPVIIPGSPGEPELAIWNADLWPVGGPVLGPFSKRADALAAELEYLAQLLSSSRPAHTFGNHHGNLDAKPTITIE